MAKRGKRYSEQKDVRVDFTPMVDMNMLLITFFMLCTTMIKSQTLQIALPTNEKVEQNEQNKAKESEAITILLDSDVDENGVATKEYVYFYEGIAMITPDGSDSNLQESEFLGNEDGVARGIRAVLQKKNKDVYTKIVDLKAKWKAKEFSKKDEVNDSIYKAKAKEIRNDSTLTRPVVIIKATPRASYKSVVTALDEMQINNISRYQIDRITHDDSTMMKPYWDKREAAKK
ncbi:MAG: biopolymer transporter ExbD [Muribaculaceae bacterium]|nr:biopolymer transporter ExbD [Muribaculaceae bacterium]MBQ7212145.1 biopolymer transporter ExbD [Muribaculaceae bacterium]